MDTFKDDKSLLRRDSHEDAEAVYGSLGGDRTKNHGRSSMDTADGHSHSHHTRRKTLEKDRRRLQVATFLSFTVMIAEIIGGYLAGSLAIMTDAVHLLVDFISFSIALLVIFLAKKRPSKRLTYGWYRAEILGALFSVLLIWVMTGVLIYLGVMRFVNLEIEIDSVVMMITAAIALTVNFILGFVLHYDWQSCCSSEPKGESEDNCNRTVNLRAAMLHVIGDIFQSLSVLIGATILYFKPTWVVIDPILTIIFSCLVFLTSCRLFRDLFVVLMEAKPRTIDFIDVTTRLNNIKGVEGVHSLRIWSLTMSVEVITAHLVIDNDCDNRRVLREAYDLMELEYDVHNSTFQLEYSDENAFYICADTPGPMDTDK